LKSETLALLVGVTLMACSSHYEVGRMDPQAAGATKSSASGSNGVFPIGSGGSAGSAGGGDTQLDAPAGGEPGMDCSTATAPMPLSGPFQAPAEVWNRISTLLFAQPATPPSALPSKTTYDWAGQIVQQLFDQAAAKADAAPGADDFVQTWLELDSSAEPLSQAWGRLLAADQPALDVLLETPQSDARRVGVFSERAWLKVYPLISTRGYLISQAVLGVLVPPEPGSVRDRPDSPPAAGYSRRQQLEASVAYPSCAACHNMIDPLGLSLEHFDGQGVYQTLDAAQPVDSSGMYLLRLSGRTISFEDVADLGSQLADTCEANAGFASHYLALGLTRLGVSPELLTGVHDANVARFQQAFVAGGRSYRALVTAFAQSSAVLERPAE